MTCLEAGLETDSTRQWLTCGSDSFLESGFSSWRSRQSMGQDPQAGLRLLCDRIYEKVPTRASTRGQNCQRTQARRFSQCRGDHRDERTDGKISWAAREAMPQGAGDASLLQQLSRHHESQTSWRPIRLCDDCSPTTSRLRLAQFLFIGSS